MRSSKLAGSARLNPILARLVVLAAVSALLVLVSAVGADARHTAAEKRAQAEAIIAEIQAIDEEVGHAAERWNGANLELESVTRELAETRRALVGARKHLVVSRARVAERLRYLYVDGDGDSTLEVILGARTLDDIIAGLEAIQRVSAQDASIARAASSLRTRVEQREERLAEAREEQEAIVAQLEAEKQAIEAKLVERQQLLVSVKDEIARLEEAERRRQAELRRQTQLALQRQQAAAAEAQAAQQASPAVAAADEPAPPAPSPTVDFEAPPADASKGAQVVAIAMQYLGIPYVWGSANPSVGFDCSGLTKYVFAQVGVGLPHYAAAQYQLGYAVSRSALQPGDLVFFRGLGHMGMYIGGGNFIHAPRTGDVVKISSLSDSYYVANWVGARRVL